LADRSDPADASPRSAWLLLAGAAAGLLLASAGLLEAPIRDDASLPPDAAARVGERTIRRVDYERVLAGVAGDLRSPVDEDMRRRVLDRMIDEELLVQRALALGLAHVDRRVRGELTSSMIDSIVAEVGSETPSNAEVARHYEENLEFFTRPGRLRARRLYFSTRRDGDDPRGTAEERALKALADLRAGSPPDAVEQAWADRQVSPVPDALLPPSKVRDYVGPGLLQVLATLDTGAWSAPQESASSLSLVAVLDREPPVVPPLDEIESLVRQDLERRRGDEALRRYLDELRAASEITIDARLFEGSTHDTLVEAAASAGR
jgi:hypothetical protein